jgi:hypothetical protein
MIWWQPDVFLVSGMPGNGKSWFAINYSNTISNTVIFHIDVLFSYIREEFPDEDGIKETFDIFRYINSIHFNKESFLRLFREKFLAFMVDKIKCNSIIIEGYVCDILYEEIKQTIKSLYNFENFYNIVCKLDQIGYGVLLNGNHIGYANQKNYDKIIRNIHSIIIEQKNIIRNTTYQQYPWITNINSKSEEKYEKSIKSCNFVGKTFIDFGCNSGWFCFRAKERGSLKTLGIDRGENWIKLANDINCSIYNYGNMEWYFCDIFDFSVETTYDIIFCASTFHYFGEKQKQFIELIHKMSDEKSEVFLEVEISPKKDVDIDWASRNSDSCPMAYPTMSGFLNMVNGLFKIESTTESAFQPGSLYTRYFFKMRKN